MRKSVKIALHIIESYYNLENELSMLSPLLESEFSDCDEDELSDWSESSIITDVSLNESGEIIPLFEHRGDYICLDDSKEDGTKYHQLFEHRGKPDPEKVREREEARKRGAERHKNALERKRKEELLRKANKIKKQGQTETESEKKQQQSNNLQQQKQQKQQVLDAKQQQEAEKINLKAKQSKAQLDHTIKHMSSTAPTTDAKRHSKDMSNDIDDMNRQMVSAYAKLTPSERKRRKQREREEMSERYDQIEDKYLKKMKTPEERVWFKKNFAKIKRVGIGTADNVFDLMGYKAVYTDIAEATKFILGKKS